MEGEEAADEDLVVLVDDGEDVEGELGEVDDVLVVVDCLDEMNTMGGARRLIGLPLTIGSVVVVLTDEGDDVDDVELVDEELPTLPPRDESAFETVGHSRGTNTGSQ